MHSLKFYLLAITLTLGASKAYSDDSTFDKFVDKTIAVYGGAALIKQHSALRESGSTFSNSQNRSGSVLRAYQYPDRFHIEIHYDGAQTESRILNGDKAWKDGRPAMPPMRAAILLQATRIDLPRVLVERRSQVRDLGEIKAEDGKPRHAVEIPLDGDMKVIAEIDPGSGHILKSRGLMSVGAMQMEFATDYDDFRRVDGHLVAFKETHYAMGGNIGHTTLDKIEFTDKLDAALFQP